MGRVAHMAVAMEGLVKERRAVATAKVEARAEVGH